MLETIWTIAVVLFLFGLTIFVHELGHFLVARWLGLKAEVFAIGMGPALWKKKVNGVVYKIGAFPIGGYVALPQMDPSGPAEEEGKEPLPYVAPWRKILVAVAGAVGNIILAVILAYIIFWAGKPSLPHETTTVIGYVDTESAAYEAGLRPGDAIRAVNDESVKNWNEIFLVITLNETVKVDAVTSDGQDRAVTLVTEQTPMRIRRLPGVTPINYCKVLGTIPGLSAEQAGILPGDMIVELDSIPLKSREHLSKLVQERRDKTVPVVVKRGEELVSLSVTPQYSEDHQAVLMGIQFNTIFGDETHIVHPEPWGQVWDHGTMIFRFIKALVTPREARAAAAGVSGPLEIFRVFWISVQEHFVLALWFTCFLNVNLAVLNLLPIPILDGGHVMFSLWEMLTRKPISKKFVGIVSQFFVILLLALFVFLTYRDARRMLPGKATVEPAEGPADTTNTPAEVVPAP